MRPSTLWAGGGVQRYSPQPTKPLSVWTLKKVRWSIERKRTVCSALRAASGTCAGMMSISVIFMVGLLGA